MNLPRIVSINPTEADPPSASLSGKSFQVSPSTRSRNREIDQLKEELRRTRQEADDLLIAYHKLLEVSRSVTALREPDEMFTRVLEAAVSVTGAERGFLFVLPPGAEPKSENLEVAAAHQIQFEEIAQGQFQVSRSAILSSLKHRTTVVIGGGSREPSQSMTELGLRAILCEPLMVERQILGLLYLDTTLKSSFCKSHADLLRSFGAQAAVCLANIRLMQARDEANRRQYAQEAQRESLSAFLAVASRELRDPVTALTTGIRVMKSERVDETTKRIVLDDLERSIKKTERMLRSYDILREFKEGGVRQVYKQPVPIAALLEERLDATFQLLGPELRSKFQISIQAPADIEILADRFQVSQILDYLLQNAVSYSASGGQLHLWLDEDDESQCIYLRDEGAAIEESLLQAIQEGQPRVDVGLSKRGEQLGLFVAANLALAHNGSLTVTSGDSTTFCLRLPRQP